MALYVSAACKLRPLTAGVALNVTLTRDVDVQFIADFCKLLQLPANPL